MLKLADKQPLGGGGGNEVKTQSPGDKSEPGWKYTIHPVKGHFFPRYATLLGRPGRVGWLGGGEETASRAERAASWRNDPRIQLFFFLLSPRCLEKHKDFDIWAEQRGGNTTMAHADFPFRGIFFSPRLRENYTFTFSRFLLPRHNTQIKSIKKAKPQHQPNPYSKLIYVSE